MKKLQILILFVFISFFSTSLLADESNLSKGWEFFKTNDYIKAREYFTLAANEDNPSVVAEANLAMSLMASVDEKPEDAFSYFQRFYKAEKEPSSYLFALWYTESINGKYGAAKGKEQVEFFNDIANSTSINETMRVSANFVLGKHYEATNNFSKGNDFFLNVGAIMQWQAVGEFENISGSGLDKDFPPIHQAKPDNTFKNKYGADIHWIDINKTLPGRWIRFPHHFYTDNSIIFAQTFCESPVDQEVIIRIGTSGSLKLWCNDKLMFSEPKERNNGIDTYSFSAKLYKGFNRILIQVGTSEITNSNFLMRVTDESGKNIDGLTFGTQFNQYPQEQDFQSTSYPLFAEEYFKKMMEQHPDKLVYQLMLAETYLRNDKKYEARKILTKALDKSPDCSYIISKLTEVYLREDNSTEYYLALDKMKKVDPDNPASLILLFNDAMDEDDIDKAKEILEQYKKVRGEDSFWYGKMISIGLKEEQYEDVIKLVYKGYENFPENSQFVILKFNIDKALKRTSTPEAVLKKYLKKRYNDDVLMALVNYYFENRNPPKAQSYFDKVLEHNPTAVGYLKLMGDHYSKTGSYIKAINYFKQASEIAPFVGDYYKNIANSYEQINENEKAIEYYKKSVAYNPNDYDSRKNIRRLEDKPDIFDYFDKPDVYEIYKNSPSDSDYPEDNSLVLLDETQSVVYSGGGNEEKTYFMVKVFDATGIDDWKEYVFSVSNNERVRIDKAEVLKSNGNKLKATINNDHVVFESLEAGDAILVIYKTEYYNGSTVINRFWGKHYFQGFYPYVMSKYSLLVENGRKFNYKVKNSSLEPVIEEKDDFTLYTWSEKNMEAIRYESFMPSLEDFGEILYYSNYDSWNDISNWYYDVYRNKSNPDFEVKEVATGLFKDKRDISDYEKAKIIYNYIVTNIRYISVPFLQNGIIPQKASAVINKKIGDCKDVSTLFVALCREVGIDGSLVLINTRDNGENEISVPMIEFNHAIAKATLNGKDYYIELTADYQPFSTFSYYLKNSFALEAGDGDKDYKPFLLDPPTRAKNIIRRIGTVKFEGNSMIVKKKNLKTGYDAAMMRSGYRDEGNEKRNKDIQQSISLNYPRVKLISVDFNESLMDNSDTLTYSFSYKVDNVFSKISDLYLLKLPLEYIQESADFLNTEDRKYPIEIGMYFGFEKNMETVDIEIPEGMQLAEIPENSNFSCRYADYSKEFIKEGNVLHLTQKFIIKNDYVALDGYRDFKDFIENVVEADSRQIAFKKK